MVKLKDIAKRAGVGVSTASYALNNRPEIREETRQKVLKAARELNYKPSGVARDLRKAKTGTIGILLSDLYGPFYSELIKSVEEVVFSNGYNLIACSSYGGKNSTAAKFLEEKRTDGILALAQDISDSTFRKTASKNFPIVLLDREVKGDYIWSITVNNKQGAYNIVTYLIQSGYTEIGYFSGPVNSWDNRERFEGYKTALEEHTLLLRQQWVVQGQFTMEGGYRAAKTLLLQNTLPQAVFSANDEMAIGAINAFQEAGLSIPDDIALVGFDDIEMSNYVRPKLTTVQQPKGQMGNLAAHMIFRALNGDFSIENVRLETALVIRKSCQSVS